MKKKQRWARIGLSLVLAAAIGVCGPAARAVTRSAVLGHKDWPMSCIKAYDLVFTAEEYEAALASGTLQSAILGAVKARVLYGEDREPYSGGFQDVDMGGLPDRAEAGTYPVTLFLFSENTDEDHITVQLTVEVPEPPPAPEPEPTPEPTPEPAEPPARPTPAPSAAPASTQEPLPEPTPAPEAPPSPAPTPVPVVVPPEEPPPPEGPMLPKYTYVAAFTASGISALWMLLIIIHQTAVVIWHRRRRRLALTRTAEEWEREELDE